ncbi:MAG: sugar ABC transporter ATP-binding protein [Clostridiaceae bacterium]|nr:sugar ABC transporter ATP-binding protein [Clostridiaceae bacterium]
MTDVILKMKGITKAFNNNIILNDVDFELKKGEIHAIIGENGSGKSTLVKIISGIYQYDDGSIYFEDKPVYIKNPAVAINLGISVVQQEPFLFDHFTVAENIFSENHPIKNRFLRTIDRDLMLVRAQEILDSMEFSVSSDTIVGNLNLGQKRMVEIAKAFCQNSKVIILDEPTASLSAIETKALYTVMKNLKSNGVSIIYISQRFEEIVRLVDRITVLRDGRVTGCTEADSADFQQLVKMMSGECLYDRYPKLRVKQGHEIFSVEELNSGGFLTNVSFSLARGEIVGITGLIGSGKTKLARVIFGLEQKSSGEIFVDRLKASIMSPKDAIELGIAYVTEDRFSEGMFCNLSVLNNIFSIENAEDNRIILNNQMEGKLFKRYVKKAKIDVNSPSNKILELSGGNQQKAILVRWFLTNARIIIFDEPTRGVDITSKVDIYNLMNDLVRKGAGIIMISSDIEELIGMCDRLLIMNNGCIVADLYKNELSYEKIYQFSIRN